MDNNAEECDWAEDWYRRDVGDGDAEKIGDDWCRRDVGDSDAEKIGDDKKDKYKD